MAFNENEIEQNFVRIYQIIDSITDKMKYLEIKNKIHHSYESNLLHQTKILKIIEESSLSKKFFEVQLKIISYIIEEQKQLLQYLEQRKKFLI